MILPLTQKFIFRSDLQANPDVFYLFGDNCQRVGMGGQAKEMRNEPNAIGVATKLSPTSADSAFFSDDNFLVSVRVMATDLRPAFQYRNNGHLIVIPEDGLGTGFSELPQRAPRINAVLEDLLNKLKTGGNPAWKQLLNG